MTTEKKPQAKKEWKTPELIVLVRSKPEEAVLGACKHSGHPGQTYDASFCDWQWCTGECVSNAVS